MGIAVGQWPAIDPVHVHRMHGASQRYVEQAQPFFEFLVIVHAAVFDEIRRAQVDAALAAGIVITQQFR